jgi:methionine sulfoxide reductase catalytic subunit
MLIRKPDDIPSSEITPRSTYLNRRAFMAAAGAAGVAAVAGKGMERFLNPATVSADTKLTTVQSPLSTKGLTPTSYNDITHYNNFYEFGTDKDIVEPAQALKVEPWTVKIDGMVEKPITISFDDLVKKMGLEERLYRHRCVEAWSMAVPWTGFALAKLVDFARPLGSAKYLQMTTFMDPSMAPEQNKFFYPWPYVEGLTMFEARNELAFLVTGMYGKPVPKQDGAPLRLAVPWKYGFKSVKSIVHFEFTDKQPTTFWEALQSSEYGFWANVNPAVPHPRWSQATERVLGSDERVPTQIWNGYGEFVAGMYKGLEGERLFA